MIPHSRLWNLSMIVKPQKIARPLNVSVEPPVTPVVEPCGKDCFILFNDIKGKSPAVGRHLFLILKMCIPSLFWAGPDHPSIETISTILSVCPELNSCQLAVVCVMPCNLVNIQSSPQCYIWGSTMCMQVHRLRNYASPIYKMKSKDTTPASHEPLSSSPQKASKSGTNQNPKTQLNK